MPRPKKEQPNHAGGLYEVKITTGKTLDGKLIRKSFYSSISKEDAKRQAEEWKVNQKVAEQTGTIFVQKEGTTFSQWAKQWLEIYKKPNVDASTYQTTYESFVSNHLNPFFGKAVLNNIRPADVQKFYTMKQSMSKSAMSKMKLCLNGIFDTAIENDLCVKNPAKHIEPESKRQKNTKHVYSNSEIQKVELYAKAAMPEIVILLETGLRRGELLGLKWDDINLENKTISVNRSIADAIGGGVKINPPKWNSFRTNPLTNKATEIFNALPRLSSYVFPLHGDEPQRPHTWGQKLTRFMAQMNASIGVPALTAHELRHTCGTAMRRNGVDIYTIQKIMGHRDIKMTTEIYVHNEVEVLRNALNKKSVRHFTVVRKAFKEKNERE